MLPLFRLFLLMVLGALLTLAGCPSAANDDDATSDDDDATSDDDDATSDDDDATSDDDDSAAGDDDDATSDDDDSAVGDDDDDVVGDDDDSAAGDDDDAVGDDDDSATGDDDDSAGPIAASITGTLISGIEFVSPGGVFQDCENIYNVTSSGAAPAGCPGCDVSGEVTFQSVVLGCPADQLADSSGGFVAVGVDIAGSQFYVDQLNGSGWLPYAGAGTVSGTAASGSLTGTLYDDNGGNFWCFDLDGDLLCDPNSTCAFTEEFIVNW